MNAISIPAAMPVARYVEYLTPCAYVEDLTVEDHIATEFPYSFRAERFKTFFFNVCNGDNGRTWSTPWIIDDPTLYYLPD